MDESQPNAGRKCETTVCQNTIDDTKSSKRQRFCATCRVKRRAEARERFRDRAKKGIPSPRSARGVANARTWLCDYLANVPCACGERRLPCLQLYRRGGDADAPRQPTVAELVARGTPIATLIEIASACDVRCANCQAMQTAIETQSYRLAHGKAPGFGVLSTMPQLTKRRRAVIREPEVERARAPHLPAHEVTAQPAPREPADGGPQVAVGDVATASAPRDPVEEDQRGRRVDDAIGARDGGQLPAHGVDGDVVGAGVRFRRLRQR